MNLEGSYNQLAGLYRKTGKQQEAERILGDSRARKEQRRPATQPSLAAMTGVRTGESAPPRFVAVFRVPASAPE